jgi:diadenosine tetraphosphate (Ap4A) HIT family hydrolase
MKYDELVNFIEAKMRMSHVYQPLLIRSLIDAGGSATVRQIAQSFLVQDESQLAYYEGRIKTMPVKVLSNHGVVHRDGDLVSLSVRKLSLKQKAHLRLLCEMKLQEHVQKRGLGIWDYRMLETDPVPDSVQFQVLKRASGRCELCGATKKERPLHIDHIIPRSRKGTNDLENLQVLCDKHNLAKSNKDTTDLRDNLEPERMDGCLFCSDDVAARKVADNETVFAVEDGFPVTKGHLLIIPRRHTHDYFTMTARERNDAEELVRVLCNRVLGADKSVTGINVGMNCGESAGQTIHHAHIHLIPRRDGDTEKPRGGVRGVVPDRMDY